jgi:DNA-binding transcriptional ArsR family regulator
MPLKNAAAEELLTVENRRRIYERIQAMPGIHLRQIQRDLNISMGTLEYHLRRLELEGIVVTRETNRFKSYFTIGELDRRDKDYLYYLRQPMPRRIAREISERPYTPLKLLIETMPVAPSTLSFHLKKLVRCGMIKEFTRGRTKFYELANPVRMARLLERYGELFDGADLERAQQDLIRSQMAVADDPAFRRELFRKDAPPEAPHDEGLPAQPVPSGAQNNGQSDANDGQDSLVPNL